MNTIPRIKTEWTCVKCGEYVTKPWDDFREYTSSIMDKDGVWKREIMTVERQREYAKTCYECDGSGYRTALDVQTAEQYEGLDEDEQRRVRNCVTDKTPIPVIVAILTTATQALNHEDEEYVPSINVAIEYLEKAHVAQA